MAASRVHFSQEQVLEEVCAKEEVFEENEDPELSLEDVLKLSLDNFHHLRPPIRNFLDFCEEAHGELAAVYHRHENGFHGMDKVLLSNAPVWPMISGEVLQWLSGIRRRMSANPKSTDPWTNEIKRDLPKEIIIFKSKEGHSMCSICIWRFSRGYSDYILSYKSSSAQFFKVFVHFTK